MWMPFGHSLNSTSPRDLGCSWSNDPVGGFNDLTFPHDVTFFGDGLKGCWWPPTKGSKGHGLNHLVGTHTKRVKWSNLTNMFFFNYVLPFYHIANDSWLKWWVCRGWWITGWWVYKWSLTNIFADESAVYRQCSELLLLSVLPPTQNQHSLESPQFDRKYMDPLMLFFSCQPHVRFREGRFVTQFDGWEKWTKDIATNWWWIPWLLIIWKVLWTDFPVFGRGLATLTTISLFFGWLSLLANSFLP